MIRKNIPLYSEEINDFLETQQRRLSVLFDKHDELYDEVSEKIKELIDVNTELMKIIKSIIIKDTKNV